MFSWLYNNVISPVANWVGSNIVTPVSNWIEDTFVGNRRANETNERVANENVALTRETNNQNLEFQKQENDITREREDNAVRRAAIDMEAAGLSKTLAAGSPASAASLSPATMVAPHNDYKAQKVAKGAALLSVYNTLADLDIKKAEAEKVKEETKSVNIANSFAFDNHKMDLAIKKSQIDLNSSTLSLNDAKTKLTHLESSKFVEKVDAEIDKILTDISLTRANRSYVFEKILTEVKSRGLIDKQNEAYTIAYINQQLNYDINKYNLDYAKVHLKPVNYNYGTTDATILALLGGLLKNGLGSGSATSFNPNWL